MTDPELVPELIDVRPDESFDEAALAGHLRGRLDGASSELTVEQFAGGHANLTYLLRFATGEVTEYVLRRPPLGPVAPSSHDMAREYRVLSNLWRAFPLAPRAFLFCDDEDLIGAPFFIMERRRGIVVRKVVPAEFGGGDDVQANRKLSQVVIDTLVDLHAVDPEDAGLAGLGHPDGYIERQVTGWTRRWEAAKTGDNRLADEVARWLADHLSVSPAPTLVHNDWRLDNMAVDPAEPGRCVAVYDWDMCTRGDPLADLGTLMALWFDSGEMLDELNPMPTTVPGFMNRREAIERYVQRSGRDHPQLDWYVVFGTFKIAVVSQQIYVRWVRGQTKDDRFRAMGPAAERLFELAAERRRPG